MGERCSEPHNSVQQEPRLFSNFSKDENMISAYKENRDLYATVASVVHGNSYWDNMENYEDGTPNPEGKKRRQDVKSLVLGMLYGRGAASVAEQLKSTTEEAQQLIDKFFLGFPKAKVWIEGNKQFARKYGYVEDLWGRRRRLRDLQLPKYQANSIKSETYSIFNPLLYVSDKVQEVENPLVESYLTRVRSCRGRKDFEALRKEASQNGIELVDNGYKISQAERQCTNSVIQGSAASMSKRALLRICRDELLNEWGFKPLILVHDEIIGECPEQYSKQVADRLSEIMRHAAEPECVVPFKVDCVSYHAWYEEEYYNDLQEEVDDLRKKGLSESDVVKNILASHIEITESDLKNHIKFEQTGASS